jgi:hypothetical protein
MKGITIMEVTDNLQNPEKKSIHGALQKQRPLDLLKQEVRKLGKQIVVLNRHLEEMQQELAKLPENAKSSRGADRGKYEQLSRGIKIAELQKKLLNLTYDVDSALPPKTLDKWIEQAEQCNSSAKRGRFWNSKGYIEQDEWLIITNEIVENKGKNCEGLLREQEKVWKVGHMKQWHAELFQSPQYGKQVENRSSIQRKYTEIVHAAERIIDVQADIGEQDRHSEENIKQEKIFNVVYEWLAAYQKGHGDSESVKLLNDGAKAVEKALAEASDWFGLQQYACSLVRIDASVKQEPIQKALKDAAPGIQLKLLEIRSEIIERILDLRKFDNYKTMEQLSNWEKQAEEYSQLLATGKIGEKAQALVSNWLETAGRLVKGDSLPDDEGRLASLAADIDRMSRN